MPDPERGMSSFIGQERRLWIPWDFASSFKMKKKSSHHDSSRSLFLKVS